MNKLIERVKEVQAKTGLSQKQISINMGYSANNLNEALRKGCSTKKQQEFIDLLDRVEAGEIIPSTDQLLERYALQIEDLKSIEAKYLQCIQHLESANMNTAYWISKLPKTRFQAFKLFIKILFGVKP